jgi:hypothetical protein
LLTLERVAARPAAADRSPAKAGDIRACVPDDIPAVARMFQAAFRKPRAEAPVALQACLRELFFEHPWQDRELTSRVYIAADGSIGGFIGTLPLRMSFHGRPVRAAVPSSLVVDRPEENPLAGAKLLRSFIAGPQEISITDTANALSAGMIQRLGGQAVTSESMEWLRVFRPAAFALTLVDQRFPAARLARPICSLADRLAAKASDFFRLDESARAYADADVSDDTLVEWMPKFAAHFALRPEWDAVCLKWMLVHAARNAGRGTLFRRMVYGRDRAPLGCYLYHGRPGRIAWVLQVLTRPGAAEPVIDSLLAHAYRNGSIAVKGRTQLSLLDALLRRQCMFFRRNAAMVHSRNAELIAAVRAGDAITSGLAAETWTRLVGDTFG